MALKPFNSVAGFSTGETQVTIVNADGNIAANALTVAATANVTGNLDAGNVTTTGTANIGTLAVTGSAGVTGNITGGNITTVGIAQIGTLDVTGAAGVFGNLNAGNVTTGGTANVGTLAVTGSADVTGNLDVGNVTTTGTANIGTLAVTGNADVTGDVTGGNLITTGEANVGTLTVTTDVSVGGNILVTGNLSVEGNLIYVNVESLTVEDPIITVGTGPNGAPLTTNDGKDRGLAMEYFDTAAKFAYAGYKNATGTYSGDYVIAKEATLSDDVVTVVELANVVAGIYKGTFEAPGNITEVLFNDGANIAGDTALTFDSATGTLTAGNITTVGTANVATLEVTGSGNITGNLIVLDTANVSTLLVATDANVTGNITANGDIAGEFITANANIDGDNITAASNLQGNVVLVDSELEVAAVSTLTAGTVTTTDTSPTTLFTGTADSNYEVTVSASDGTNIVITKVLATAAGDYTVYGQTVTGTAPGSISVTSAANTVTVTVTSAAATSTTYNYQATGL